MKRSHQGCNFQMSAKELDALTPSNLNTQPWLLMECGVKLHFLYLLKENERERPLNVKQEKTFWL